MDRLTRSLPRDTIPPHSVTGDGVRRQPPELPADDSYGTFTQGSFLLPADPERSLLNEHQRRHFEVVLAMLQDVLAEVEQLASPVFHGTGALTLYQADLPEDFAAAIHPFLSAVRQRIGHLAAALGVRPRLMSRAQAIRALLTAEMVRLEDSTTKQLRGYGAVDPRFADEVEPVLREMRDVLASVIALLDTPATARTTSTFEHRT